MGPPPAHGSLGALLLLVLLVLQLPAPLSAQGSCDTAQLEPFCGSARRANVGNCILCVRSHPQVRHARDSQPQPSSHTS